MENQIVLARSKLNLSDVLAYGKLAVATIVWWAAYSVLLPVTQWLTYDVLRLGRGSHLGESVVGLSLSETIILRRVIKPQLIAVFIGVVAIAIIITGYLFNWVM